MAKTEISEETCLHIVAPQNTRKRCKAISNSLLAPKVIVERIKKLQDVLKISGCVRKSSDTCTIKVMAHYEDLTEE